MIGDGLRLLGLRVLASPLVPPGSVIVMHPDTLARTLSLGPAMTLHPFDPEVPPVTGPTVAELLAGFDAKVEEAIARVARRHREEDLRRAHREGWRSGDIVRATALGLADLGLVTRGRW